MSDVPPNPQEPVVITISLDQSTGNIEVNGPLHSEILMYGMLEKARQITEAYTRRATAPLISRAPMPFPKAVH